MLIECNDTTTLRQRGFDPGALLGHHGLSVFAGRALNRFDLFEHEPALGRHTLGIFLKPSLYPGRQFVANGCNNQLQGGVCQPLVVDRRGAAFLAAVLAGDFAGGLAADLAAGFAAGLAADLAAVLEADVFFTDFAGALLAVLLVRAADDAGTLPAVLVTVLDVFFAVFFAAVFESPAVDLGSVAFLVLGLRASVPRLASASRISLSPHNSSRR